MLEQFYEECLKFWQREGVENPEELALKDVSKLKTNPFSPNGEAIDAQDVATFVQNRLNLIKR